MTDAYQIAIGHNNSGSLQTVYPQPNCQGIQAGRRTEGGDGLIYQDGKRHARWNFGYLTVKEMDTLLSQAGLGEGTPSANVTIRMPRNTPASAVRIYQNYNAVIVLPDFPGDAKYAFMVYQELAFDVTRLQEI